MAGSNEIEGQNKQNSKPMRCGCSTKGQQESLMWVESTQSFGFDPDKKRMKWVSEIGWIH